MGGGRGYIVLVSSRLTATDRIAPGPGSLSNRRRTTTDQLIQYTTIVLEGLGKERPAHARPTVGVAPGEMAPRGQALQARIIRKNCVLSIATIRTEKAPAHRRAVLL